MKYRRSVLPRLDQMAITPPNSVTGRYAIASMTMANLLKETNNRATLETEISNVQVHLVYFNFI